MAVIKYKQNALPFKEINKKVIYPITADFIAKRTPYRLGGDYPDWCYTSSKAVALKSVGKKRLFRLPDGVYTWRKPKNIYKDGKKVKTYYDCWKEGLKK